MRKFYLKIYRAYYRIKVRFMTTEQIVGGIRKDCHLDEEVKQ